jgi:predicted DNA-binding protein (MmcQ/YjbR family)
LFEYAREYFGSKPEYLWSKFPSYAVLCHQDNNKWFAVVLNVSGSKVGLKIDKEVDIINVKVRPEYIGSLRLMKGVFPAYHMNKEHWISVLLDGSLSPKEICELLTDSHELTS